MYCMFFFFKHKTAYVLRISDWSSDVCSSDLVTASSNPDFRTISEFRKRHLKALSGLFVQVLKLCAEAGLVKLGHVALDGTKIKANASKHRSEERSGGKECVSTSRSRWSAEH